MNDRILRSLVVISIVLPSFIRASHAGEIYSLWPKTPPGYQVTTGEEKDMTTDKDGKVAGKRVMRIGNVASPTVEVFLPPEEKRNGTAVVICPGGGFNILAYDLEGTEVAEWLNGIGVTAVVLKYRVPIKLDERKWVPPAQDAHRAIRWVRANAEKWAIKVDRIGILGFSAGGATAARAALHQEPGLYDAIDEIDQQSTAVNFSVLIYPAYLVDKDQKLVADLPVTSAAPPTFVVHTFDDPVRPENGLELVSALKRSNVPSELHLYDRGGHGYGLRPTELPVTGWPKRCEEWLERHGWLAK